VGQIGASVTPSKSSKPLPLGIYYKQQADGRLQVELGQKRFLVTGVIRTLVDGSVDERPRWDSKATCKTEGFDSNSPRNCEVVLKDRASGNLVQVIGLFTPAKDPAAGATPGDDVVATRPTAVQGDVVAHAIDGKAAATIASKRSRKQHTDEEYHRELDRVQQESAKKLDPQVQSWFAERFLGVHHSTLYRKLEEIDPEAYANDPQRKGRRRRHIRFADLLSFRQTRMGGGRAAQAGDKGQRPIGGGL
jgi:hypothetical protein